MKHFSPLILAAALAASTVASNAFADDAWLACKGTVATFPKDAKAPSSTAPSERVLVLNDGIKRIYQWFDARKQMSPLPEKIYTDNEVTWDVTDRATAGSYWKGKLDRAKNTVNIEMTEGDLSRLIWTEACAPTPPRDQASMAVSEPTAGPTKVN